jgi:hypothetical protein
LAQTIMEKNSWHTYAKKHEMRGIL